MSRLSYALFKIHFSYNQKLLLDRSLPDSRIFHPRKASLADEIVPDGVLGAVNTPFQPVL